MDKPRRHNVVVVLLSRLKHATKKYIVDDEFTNENLFSILEKSPWFADIENYLETGKFPPHVSYIEHSKIIRNNAK